MAYGFWVTSFSKQAGSGNQDIPLPAGIPDLSIASDGTWGVEIVGTGLFAATPSSGTITAHLTLSHGFVSKNSGSINQCSVGVMSVDNTGSANSNRTITNAACIRYLDSAGSVYGQATFVSFVNVSGTIYMRLNWSHIGSGNGGAFIVIVRTGLTNCEAGVWDGTSTPSKTGLSFSPEYVRVFGVAEPAGSLPVDNGNLYYGSGCFNDRGQQCFNSIFVRASLSTSNSSEWQQTDSCGAIVNENETTVIERKLVSINADGWTWSGNAGYRIPYLAMEGVSTKIGAFAKSAGTAPFTQSGVITRQYFIPDGAVFWGLGAASQTSPSANARYSFGVTDGTRSRSIGVADQDNQVTSKSKSLFYSDKSFSVFESLTPNLYDVGTAVITDDDTIDYAWTSSVTEGEILYSLEGDSGTDTYPQTIAI